MKKFQKVGSLATVITILMTSVVGCTSGDAQTPTESTDSVQSEKAVNVNPEGYPVVNEPISIKALGYGEPGAGEWKDYPIFSEISGKTGVDVEFQTISGDGATEKLNLILASNELPDVFFSGLSTTMITKYANQGMFTPLERLIEEYAPNLTKIFEERPEIRKAITMPDGHIYALPGINSETQTKGISTQIILNKTWLDNLGLEIPTTTEEFQNVLKAFKTQDPNGNGKNDEIPFSYEPVPPYNVWNGDTGLSGAFGVVDGTENIMVKDNALHFTPIQEGYKEYIKWTRDMYAEGLLDAEIFTQDHNQYMSKVTSDYLGGYLTNGPVESSKVEWISIAPLIGPNGDQLWSSIDFSIDLNRAIISSTNIHPEATMRYLDSFYEKENSLKLRYGNTLVEKDGKYEVVPNEPGISSQAPGPYVPSLENLAMADDMIKTEKDAKADARYEVYKPFLAEAMPLVTFLPDESKEISTISTDIKNYVNENKGKWTTGQSDIDEDWDGYIKTLENMRLDRYMEIYTTAYERYKSN